MCELTRDPGTLRAFHFSPDGDHFAVLRPGDAGRWAVELVASRTGGVVRRQSLPSGHDWVSLDEWAGDRLFVSAHEGAGSGAVFRAFAVDPWAERVEPVRVPLRDREATPIGHESIDTGPGWIARTSVGPPGRTLLDDLAGRLLTALGRPPLLGPPFVRRLRVSDAATGRLAFEMRNVRGYPLVAPDGRHVVVHDGTAERLELWDMRPWPRWPAAVGVGVAPLAAAWLAGRRPRRAA